MANQTKLEAGPSMTFIASPSMKAAILGRDASGNPLPAALAESTRIKALGQMAEQLRQRGGTHAWVVRLTTEIFREAKMPEPDEAVIDGWLYEADRGE